LDLALSPDPTRDEIFDAYNKMKDAFAASEAVRLDAAQVNRLPVALAQLIISAGRTAEASGRSFTLVSPPAAVVDGFQALGMFADFMTIGME
jgi:ABC-type transporter Mla MlaB component